jgi:divalent metal cation (Fe/Co/Zn/Cd) transporter
LIGESGDVAIRHAVEEILPHHSQVTRLLHLIAVQQGPGEVLLMMKLGFQPNLDVGVVCDVINKLEVAIRAKCPEVRWCFIEPDRPRLE